MTDESPVVASAKDIAADIADKWGKALTKSVNEGDFADFKALFVAEQPVPVVLQAADGEAEFTIGDNEGATMTWEEFHELTSKDLKAQNFLKTECQCLGVLGDRMIMESGRFNTDGEVYSEAYAMLTLNESGQVIMFEAFSDPQTSSLMSAAVAK